MHTLATAQLWVHDQDEALAFYRDKLGWTVRADVSPPELGGFRWLTVSPASQPDVAVVLMEIPGEPVFDAETKEQVQTLLAKGAVGALFLATPDVQAEYEALVGRGVEISEPPAERPWGIDTGFRDPSGNHIRLAQLVDIPVTA
ncbi:MAG TPA: VOC family protein [Solirubrobacter sp.]|nr:VOC family protein [Solirubrobacter sp.]